MINITLLDRTARVTHRERLQPVTVVDMGVKAGLEGSESVFRSTPRSPSPVKIYRTESLESFHTGANEWLSARRELKEDATTLLLYWEPSLAAWDIESKWWHYCCAEHEWAPFPRSLSASIRDGARIGPFGRSCSNSTWAPLAGCWAICSRQLSRTGVASNNGGGSLPVGTPPPVLPQPLRVSKNARNERSSGVDGWM
jgi:hypothetical protein